MEKTTGEEPVGYVLAEEKAPVVQGVDGIVRTKQGHTCCGCCCDVRRATMIVNVVSLAMGIVGIIMLLTVSSITTTMDAEDFDDDEMAEAVEAMEMGGSIGLAIALTAIRLAFNGLGIYGALMYMVWPVAASLAVFALEFLFALITFNLMGMVVFGFFIYPHVYLIQEIRSGVMSKETYEDVEKQSCCCV